MKTSPQAWSFRGVQLDLARQMESLDYIRSFIDFIAANGYNQLVLYLEGRVRTPSFPYPADDECYTPEQMRAVVRHAEKRDINVVPAVSNLAHAEHFLRYPELAHLDELRDGREGRIHSARHNVCPSLPETYAFFDAYFTELAEIFPGPYFHVGQDECFDIGVCDRCRERAEGREGQAGIFAKHLRDTHAIVTGKLNKRMVVWDDLFECYWEALSQIPRDIVLCCWQYDAHVTQPVAHFLNRRRGDLVAAYRELGFECLLGPRELSWRNTASLTRYAAPHRPLGGLMTVWELAGDFLYACYPNLAFAGRLWNNPDAAERPGPLLAEVGATLWPALSTETREAATGALSLSRFSAGGTAQAFLREAPAGHVAERTLVNQLLTHTLAGHDDDPIIEDLTVVLGRERLQLDLSDLVPRLHDAAVSGRPLDGLIADLRACLAQAEALYAARQRQWTRHRPGIRSTGDALDRTWRSLCASLAELADTAASGALSRQGLLTVEYFLPDAFSCQRVSVSLKAEGQETWTPVATNEVPKPLFHHGDDEYEHSGYLRVSYPVAAGFAAAQCRIESRGYGGIGLRCLDYRAPGRPSVAPASILAADGRIDQPQHVLDTSSSWCWLGEPDTALAFRYPGHSRALHVLTLGLA